MRWFLIVGGVLLEALAYMSQVAPEDVVSNLSRWLAWLGQTPPAWLTSPTADNWIGITAFVVGAVLLLTAWYLFRAKRQPVVHHHGDTLKAHITLGAITVSVMDWQATADFVSGISALRNEHTNVKITYYDQRHHNFAQRLSAAFEAAGWTVNFNKTAQSPWNPHHFSGIEIKGHSRYFVETIFSLLKGLRGIRMKIEPTKIPQSNPKYQHVINGVYVTIGFEE